MVSRRKGRILAFQALYFWEASSASKKQRASLEDLNSFSWLDEEKLLSLDEGIAAFSRILIAGTVENINIIDKHLKDHLENWDISRLNRVDLAVLRMSIFSLIFQEDMPASIVIDEAIGICKEYGTDDSFKFVNGVLDSIRKTLKQKTNGQNKT